MDIADLSKDAILRPGKVPRWRAVIHSKGKTYTRMLARAKHKSTLGADTEIVERGFSHCCGALLVARPDGTISKKNFKLLLRFFERDGAETLVFEYDRFKNNFVSRRLDYLRSRAYFTP